MVARRVHALEPFPTADKRVISAPLDMIPCVLVPGMPAEAYLDYMEPMVGFTIAAMCSLSPHLTRAAQEAPLLHMVTVVTAVRLGIWGSTGHLPRGHSVYVATALHWSAKSGRLYHKPPQSMAADSGDMWRQMLRVTPRKMDCISDLLDGFGALAPMFLRMGSSSHLLSGEAYTRPFVERAISSVLRARLQPGNLGDRVNGSTFWDVTIDGPVLVIRSSNRSWGPG
jgi:hypothetical protein